jgi:hypothetical protein
MLADSAMDDFSEGSQTYGRVSDHPAVAFDGIAFMLLDAAAIAAGFASESREPVHLRRVIIWIDALRFVRALQSREFSSSSLPSIIIPRMVEIIGSYCFRFCESFSSVSMESDSLLRQIESEAFSFTKLRSVCLPGSAQSIGWNVFPDSCKVSRG